MRAKVNKPSDANVCHANDTHVYTDLFVTAGWSGQPKADVDLPPYTKTLMQQSSVLL